MFRQIIKPFLISLVVVAVFALVFRFGYKMVSASTPYFYDQGVTGGYGLPNGLYYGVGQQFTATQNNLYSATVNAVFNATTTLEIYDTNIPASIHTQTISKQSGSPSIQEIIMTASTTLVVGHVYQIRFYSSAGAGNPYTGDFIHGPHGTSYPSGVGNEAYYLSTTTLTWETATVVTTRPGASNIPSDLYLRMKYNDGYDIPPTAPAYDPTVSIESDYEYMTLSYPALQFNDNYYCIASTTASCIIDYKFNSYAEGSQAWFYYSSSLVDGVPTGTKLATTTLVNNAFDTATTSIPYNTDYYGQYVTYCAYLYDPEQIDESRLFCDWKINWLGENEMEYLRAKAGLTVYDITQACASMDSSASTTFAYGVECGLRRVMYWATTPSYQTQLNFLNASQDLKDQFPMSIYYQVKDNMMVLSQEMASSSTSTIFSIPLMLYGIGDNIELLNENTFDEKLGDVWGNFNSMISYFIYTIVFLYFIKEIFRIAEKNTHDH